MKCILVLSLVAPWPCHAVMPRPVKDGQRLEFADGQVELTDIHKGQLDRLVKRLDDCRGTIYTLTAGVASGNPAVPPYAELGEFSERVRAYLMTHKISPQQIFVEIGRPHVFRSGYGYINTSPPPQFRQLYVDASCVLPVGY